MGYIDTWSRLLGFLGAGLLAVSGARAQPGFELGLSLEASGARELALRGESLLSDGGTAARFGLRLDGDGEEPPAAACYLELGGFGIGPGRSGGPLAFARKPLGAQAHVGGRSFILDRAMAAPGSGVVLLGGLGDRGSYELGALRRATPVGRSAATGASASTTGSSGQTGVFAAFRLALGQGSFGLLGGLSAREGSGSGPDWRLSSPKVPSGFGGVFLLELRSAEEGGRAVRLGLSHREGLGPGLALGLRARAGAGPFGFVAEAAARGSNFLGWAGEELGCGLRAVFGLEWRPLPLSRTSLGLRTSAEEVFRRGRVGLGQELELRARQEFRLALPGSPRPVELRLAGRLSAQVPFARSESALLAALADGGARAGELGLLLSRGLRGQDPDREAGFSVLNGRLSLGPRGAERLSLSLGLESYGSDLGLSAGLEASTRLALLAEEWEAPRLGLKAFVEWAWSGSSSLRLGLESGLALRDLPAEPPELSLRFRHAPARAASAVESFDRVAAEGALAEGDFLDDSVPESEASHDP